MKYSEELDRVSYCFGLSIASNLISSGVTTINAEAFNDAMTTVFAGNMPEIMPDRKKEAAKQKPPEKNSWQRTRLKKEWLRYPAVCNIKY